MFEAKETLELHFKLDAFWEQWPHYSQSSSASFMMFRQSVYEHAVKAQLHLARLLHAKCA